MIVFQRILMLLELMNRKGLIDRKYEEVQYMYFSLSGFSKWVVENADAEKVSLLTLDDLYMVI